MEENRAHYKWIKLFAAKRYNTKDGVIKLTPLEQQELLDDVKPLVENNSVLDDVKVCERCDGKGFVWFFPDESSFHTERPCPKCRS